MRARQTAQLIQSDLYRYAGRYSFGLLLRHLLSTPGFQFTFWWRMARLLHQHSLLRFTLYLPVRFIMLHYAAKYGVQIPLSAQIGYGLYMPHWGGIVVNAKTVIGDNCNLLHGVTIGKTDRGTRAGTPVIGDNVYIGPGAKIIGGIRVGHHAAIGANCVVTKDVPDYGVVAGVPGRLLSLEGSTGYIRHTDYAERFGLNR